VPIMSGRFRSCSAKSFSPTTTSPVGYRLWTLRAYLEILSATARISSCLFRCARSARASPVSRHRRHVSAIPTQPATAAAVLQCEAILKSVRVKEFIISESLWKINPRVRVCIRRMKITEVLRLQQNKSPTPTPWRSSESSPSDVLRDRKLPLFAARFLSAADAFRRFQVRCRCRLWP
jgi:hypothetical protein